MSKVQVDSLLKEASDWSYNEPVPGNVAAHSDTGWKIQQKNAKNTSTWILPRCFNTIGIIHPHPKVIKTIEVPSDVILICIVASSNASDREVHKRGKNETRNQVAQEIDKLIDEAWFRLDGKTQPIETTGPISGHNINFPKDHQILHDIRKHGHKENTPLPISSVFRYAVIQGLSVGTHMIDMYAHSPEDLDNKEEEYENSLAYIVNVV